MTITTRRLTYEDLLETPDDRNRYEIIDGELIVSPAPRISHQRAAFNLASMLRLYVLEHRLGEVFIAPLDIKLSEHDIVEPDILFVSDSRRSIVEDAFITEAPDLVVEVLSSSSRNRDRGPKMALYERSGVSEYWLADPDAASVTVYSATDGTFRIVSPDGDGRTGSLIVPGFLIDPAEIFAISS